MIVVGIILILLAVFLPGIPHIILTLGILALVAGIVLLALGSFTNVLPSNRRWF